MVSVVISTFGQASYDHYRLPQTLQPQHYNLRILTHLEDEDRLSFSGEVEIELRVLQPTSNITLHAGSRLQMTSNRTNLYYMDENGNKKKIGVRAVERNSKYDYYILVLGKVLEPRQNYALYIQFFASFGGGMSGYYASSYKDQNSNKTRYLSVTQFEPAYARTAFPCFDEPAFKATFNITLGHPTKYVALSNMPISKKIPMSGRKNWLWTIFEQTLPMSSYLVCYSVNDFAGLTSRNDFSVEFTTWARASAIAQCKYAAEIGPRLLDHYERMFEIDYPLPKVDQLAVPDFSAGAMENWGLITYREAALFYAPEASSEVDKQRVANIIAHELAHQWFGNLVTMKWWNDLWLNEGFATYVATLGMQKLCSKWHAYAEESLENMMIVLNSDAYYSTRAVSQTVSRASQFAEQFDPITYRKGAVIIRMMHMFIGDTTFRNGLNCYLKRHAYSNADQSDLWRSLSDAAHKFGSFPKYLDVQTVMDTWTLQAGYPLITVHRDYSRNTISINQRRFLMHGLDKTMEKDNFFSKECWFVPISYASRSMANFTATEPRVWLQCDSQGKDIPLEVQSPLGAKEDQWLILNVQLTAPFRVNYDTINWKLIIKTLQGGDFRRIHTMNRAQLIDDALALSWNGYLCYKLTLDLLRYIKQEHAYMPWRAALDHLAAIYRIMKQSPDFAVFQPQHFMNDLLSPIYDYLGGMETEANGRCRHHHIAHKTLINQWACRLALYDCVECAVQYYHRWFISNDPDLANPVPQNLRSVVYCAALRQGDESDWNFLWQRYSNATVASERRLILQALGCTQIEFVIRRYLKIIFDENSSIRKQDISLAFGAIARSDIGFPLAKDYFMNNFSLLTKSFESNYRELAALLLQITRHISSPHDYGALKMFIDCHKKLQKLATRTVRHAVELAQVNLHWRQKQQAQFTRCLKDHY
ncbi:aminopeptidase N-like isoform X3 [Drosophila obscura]|uniref:aminopeptidase N-like isoform X3 n=1 Tax=Drosophila obscura TaxID=7282 RepID=UPI001BB10F40|nr:aminopeptidase N-like isoform X3 [Drosophila obscura]